jgi:hypothetical protein
VAGVKGRGSACCGVWLPVACVVLCGVGAGMLTALGRAATPTAYPPKALPPPLPLSVSCVNLPPPLPPPPPTESSLGQLIRLLEGEKLQVKGVQGVVRALVA